MTFELGQVLNLPKLVHTNVDNCVCTILLYSSCREHRDTALCGQKIRVQEGAKDIAKAMSYCLKEKDPKGMRYSTVIHGLVIIGIALSPY